MVQLKVPAGGHFIYDEPYFNSSMVQLKAAVPNPVSTAVSNFNSSMVQLKVGDTTLHESSILFQFLYGTIKSLLQEKEKTYKN